MSRETVLLVRMMPHNAVCLAKNTSLIDRFDFVTVDGIRLGEYQQARIFQNCEMLSGTRHDPEPMKEEARGIMSRYPLSLVVLLTPLYWYSEAIRQVADEKGIPIMWAEIFPGGKVVFDRIGCQYTRDNEIIRYADSAPLTDPEFPDSTRFTQPTQRMPYEMRADYNPDNKPCVVVFGQIPQDHSLMDTNGGIGYYEWLDAVFRQNPDTLFLFKQHPHWKANANVRTTNIETYANVREVDESIWSLFPSFDAFASYSSTCIFEGAIQGKVFATGGLHYLNHPGLCMRIVRPDQASDLYEKLRAFRLDESLLKNRLSFVTRRYALKPTSPLVGDRFKLTSEEFFKEPL